MFCNCQGHHIPILEYPTVLPNAMVQRSACLPDLRSLALIAGNAVDHVLLSTSTLGQDPLDGLILPQSLEGAMLPCWTDITLFYFIFIFPLIFVSITIVLLVCQ